jgi:hypothetical protein
MIAIVNIGAAPGQDADGTHEYSVRINHREIARFCHARSQGLATCLTRAAMAVQMAGWAELAEYRDAMRTVEPEEDR